MSKDATTQFPSTLAAEERGPHIEPDRLLAYHLEELEAEDDEAIQDHLARCRDCGQDLLALAHFPDADDSEMPTGVDVQEALERVRQRYEEWGTETDQENAPKVNWYLMAALLLLALLIIVLAARLS